MKHRITSYNVCYTKLLRYDRNLKEIIEVKVPARAKYSSHTFHQYTIQIENRDELQQYLKGKGIPTMIYYPKALHLQDAYSFLGYKQGDFPVSEKLTQRNNFV